MTAQPEQRQQHKPRAGESSILEQVRLRRVNHWPAQGLSGEPADLYVDHHEASAAEAHRSRSRQDLLNRPTGDIRRPGFAITDTLLRPHPRDVGRRLPERLLSDRQASLGATLVAPDDHPILVSLRSWRWLDVGEAWRPAARTMFRALVFPVGERTTARLEGLAHDAWTRWAT
ncbi:hypothetical protein SAMN05216489_05431 [Streptomyces sp. 3213]|uniref:hypothetical protein n=1 Tax=Streptomyces sp. 3213.3 TaxID=1855348 RepID=UPI00089AECD9|nr:hypothetical protein [Streptomyces sp. 3213.3]SEE07855.1 hypothetical protein SAMN05216489_05431 [Streptomyces sp. 3213] [Streptomyces sp. 3213.3]